MLRVGKTVFRGLLWLTLGVVLAVGVIALESVDLDEFLTGTDTASLSISVNGNKATLPSGDLSLTVPVALISGTLKPTGGYPLQALSGSEFTVRLLVDEKLREQLNSRYGAFRFPPIDLARGEAKIEVVATPRHVWWLKGARTTFKVKVDPPQIGTIELNPSPTPTSSATVLISGRTAPQAYVTILVNEAPTASVEADEQGRFVSNVPLTAIGDNTIVARTFLLRKELSSAGQKIVYEPAPPALLSRKLTLELKGLFARISLNTEFTADEHLAHLLLGPKPSPEDFFRKTGGEVKINDAPYTAFFSSAAPDVKVEGGKIVVTLTSGNFSIDSSSGLTIARQGGATVPSEEDSLELIFKGHKATAFTPLPQSATDHSIQWSGTAATTGVSVDLREDRSSDFSLLHLGLDDVLPRGLGRLVSAALQALPMLWAPALLPLGLRTLWSDDDLAILRRSAVVLSAVCFVTAAYSGTIQLFFGALLNEYQMVQEYLLRRYDSLPEPFDIPLLTTLAVLAMVFAIAKVALPRKVWAWTRDGLLVLLLATAIAALLLSGLGHVFLLLKAPLSFVVLSVASGLAVIAAFLLFLRRSLRRIRGKPVVVPLGWTLLALLVVVWSLVPSLTEGSATFGESYTGAFDLMRLVSIVSTIAPLVFALLLLAVLLKNTAVALDERELKLVAPLIFASMMVSTQASWAVIPVQVVLAYFIARYAIFQPLSQRTMLAKLREDILDNRPLLLKRAVEYAKAMHAKSRRKLFGKAAKVDSERADDERASDVLFVVTPDGERVRATELALAYGQRGTPVTDAVDALRIGAWGAVFIVILSMIPLLFSPSGNDSRFPLLDSLIRLTAIGGKWFVAAFFFGYFYTAIRGRAGREKGVWVAICVTLAELPVPVLHGATKADFAAYLLGAAQRFVFFPAIGLLAFDRRIFREALGRSAAWSEVPRTLGLSATGVFGSAIVTTIGVAVTSALTGQLPAVLALLLKTLGPVQPVTPPSDQPTKPAQSAPAAPATSAHASPGP